MQIRLEVCRLCLAPLSLFLSLSLVAHHWPRTSKICNQINIYSRILFVVLNLFPFCIILEFDLLSCCCCSQLHCLRIFQSRLLFIHTHTHKKKPLMYAYNANFNQISNDEQRIRMVLPITNLAGWLCVHRICMNK